jgi:hypothetical protein
VKKGRVKVKKGRVKVGKGEGEEGKGEGEAEANPLALQREGYGPPAAARAILTW